MSTQSVADILYYYGKERNGSNQLLNKLIKRIENDTSLVDQLSPNLIAQILVTLNLVGKTNS